MIDKIQISGVFFFNISMQGRDSYRLDPATSIQERKYAVYRALPALKSDTVFADRLKCHFSISFSEEMVGLLDFLYSSRSLTFFIQVGHF